MATGQGEIFERNTLNRSNVNLVLSQDFLRCYSTKTALLLALEKNGKERKKKGERER